MQLLLYIWRIRKPISSKKRIIGIMFGIFLLTLITLPCQLERFEIYTSLLTKYHSIDLIMHALIFLVFIVCKWKMLLRA